MKWKIRVRWAVRLAAGVLGIALFAGMLFDRLPAAPSLLGYLFVALSTPWLWARQLGSWGGLAALAVMAYLPVLLLWVGWLPIDGSALLFGAAMLWLLAVWAALPSTMLLLMWRHRASAGILLLGFALMPVAVLLVLASKTYALDATTMTPAAMLQQFAMLLPLWFVIFGCGVGPFFFLGSLAWVVYCEVPGTPRRMVGDSVSVRGTGPAA